MKTCAIIVCIATLVVSIHGITEEERHKVETIHKECQSDPKTHIDEDTLRKFHDGEHIDKSVVGAHVLCMSSKFGFVSEDGKINKDVLKKAFSRGISDQAKLDEAVEKCAVEKGDAQETAVALARCIHDHAGPGAHERHHHHH